MKNLIGGIFIGLIIMFFAILIFSESYKSKSLDQPEIIRRLTRGAARWSTASEQDNNALIKTLHANYGAAYLWALEEFATSSQIEKASGVDYIQFRKKITDVQDNATKNAVQICPGYGPVSTILTKTAFESI